MRRTIFFFGLICLLIAMGGIGTAVYEIRQLTEREYKLRVDQAARAVAAHIGVTLNSVTFLFETTAHEVVNVDWDEISQSQSWWRRLKEQSEMLPHLRSVWLVDADANMRLYSDRFPTPTLNVINRDYFLKVSDEYSGALYIGEPRPGRFTGQYFVSVSYPLYDIHHRFKGIIAGALEPAHFEPFFTSILPCEKCRITLKQTKVGVDLITVGPELGAAAISKEVSFANGLGVTISVPKSHLNAAWSNDIRPVLAIGAILIIVLAVLAIYATFMLRRDEAMQAQLRSSYERVERATLAKSRFLSMMSHETRTPLNAVQGIVHLLKRDYPGTPEESRRRLDIAERSVNMLNILLSQIFDFSRAEQAAEPLSVVRFVPGDVVQTVVAGFHGQLEEAGVTLAVSSTVPDNLSFEADAERLQQILFNLIHNSLRYGPGSQISLSVRLVEAKSHGHAGATHQLVFQVTDTGPGLSDADLQMLDGDHEISDISTQQISCGLGVFLAKALTERLDGDFSVENTQGGGARFRLVLDVIPRTDGWETQSVQESEAGALNKADQRQKILVVEDMSVNRLLLSSMLAPLGYEIIEAQNGAEGVELVHHGPSFAAILMDIQMPVMDGIAATRLIRQLPEPVCHTPIIAVTANAFSDQRQSYLEAGMTHCISKPVNRDALIAALHEVITTM